MLSSTWIRYHQTFAAPHRLLHTDREREPHGSGNNETMLLIQPRKRTRAVFEQSANQQQASGLHFETQEVIVSSHAPTQREKYDTSYRSDISFLSLEQLEELSTLVSERIQIKKRYNNTPLRRIIHRQVSNDTSSRTSNLDSDTSSQTDTLVNPESPESVKETSDIIQARYNSTPLRRILSRQLPIDREHIETIQAFSVPSYEPESLEVRRARYNDTPLRRILSRQTSSPQHDKPRSADLPIASESSLSLGKTSTPTPVPRSNTPLRRILSRQSPAHPQPKEDTDLPPERADSVIDPDSPTRARHSLVAQERAKSKCEAVQITVTEIGSDAQAPERFVVDSKGSPLRRILQRQASGEWRAATGVAVL